MLTMNPAYKHTMAYISLTLNTSRDKIENLPQKNEEKEILEERKSHHPTLIRVKRISSFFTVEEEYYQRVS